MLNALTIDVEDYFQVHAFSKVIQYKDWENFNSRIEHNTDRLLNILNNSFDILQPTFPNPVRGTFFILGWIAERYPGLVRRIQNEGHEIACHGYAHRLIYQQSRDEFRQDIKRAKAILEDITGSEVVGYRAPGYSITNHSKWAFEILIEEGFKYDSSIFPIRHDFYGMPQAPRFPFIVSLNGNHHFEFIDSTFVTQNSKLVEFPISTIKLFGFNLPFSGGGYFRLFPYWLIKKGLRRINETEQKPFIFYLHPWEIDSEQPRVQALSLRSRFRHYINLDKTESKFKNLLRDFKFSPILNLLTNSISKTTVGPQHSLTFIP